MKDVLRKIISERELELPETEMGKLMKILVEERGIISLGPGEPDFTPAKHIIKFAKQKLDQGFTHYSPAEGRKELLEAIVKKLKKENKIDTCPENVIVTCGSNEAILLALICCIDPGEQVLVPDPDYVTYIPIVELLNGCPLSIQLKQENGFRLVPEEIEIKEPKRTRAIIIDNPANPTGVVYSKKILEKIADLAIENDLLILSDEAYEKFVYNGKHISIGSLNGMQDYVLTLHSFSKTYGMAGFRVGYATGPEKVIAAMRKVHLYSTLCAPTISQLAALAALRGPQGWVKKNVSEYNRRRKFIVKRFNEIPGFSCIEPQGAFYVFPKIDFSLKGKKLKSREFCEFLIKNAKVACVSGTEFGRYGEGFVRFSYATAYDLIVKAMDRIEKVVKRLK